MTSTSSTQQSKFLDWSRLRTELLWAYEGPPLKPHYHTPETKDTVICWFLLDGSAEVASRSCGKITVNTGQWLFLPPDKTSHDFSDDAAIISLRVVVHWPDGQPLYNHKQWIVFEHQDYPQLLPAARKMIQQAQRIVRKSSDPQMEMTRLASVSCDLTDYLALEHATIRWVDCYHKIMKMLGIKQTTIEPMDMRVSSCMRYIEQLAPDRKYDEPELAKSHGLSVSQLNRLFIQATGSTIKTYAENLRFNDASKQLITTHIPLKELAYLLGFKQQSHFASWFKKRTGLYPKDYRNEQQTHPWHTEMIQALKSW